MNKLDIIDAIYKLDNLTDLMAVWKAAGDAHKGLADKIGRARMYALAPGMAVTIKATRKLPSFKAEIQEVNRKRVKVRHLATGLVYLVPAHMVEL